MNKLLCVLGLLISSTAQAGTDDLTKITWKPHMVWAMAQAAAEGATYNLAVTEQAIIYKESTACKYKVGIDPYSFGCGQLSYNTANDIWTSCDVGPLNGVGPYGDCAQEGLKLSVLKNNDKLNIHISAEALAYCYWAFKGDLHRAIVCYNKGDGTTRDMSTADIEKDPYLHDVLDYIRQIEALPGSTD